MSVQYPKPPIWYSFEEFMDKFAQKDQYNTIPTSIPSFAHLTDITMGGDPYADYNQHRQQYVEWKKGYAQDMELWKQNVEAIKIVFESDAQQSISKAKKVVLENLNDLKNKTTEDKELVKHIENLKTRINMDHDGHLVHYLKRHLKKGQEKQSLEQQQTRKDLCINQQASDRGSTTITDVTKDDATENAQEKKEE